MRREGIGLRIFIDASNIRRGGGITHLVELLRAACPEKHGIERVVVCASRHTLDHIENRSWMTKITSNVMERGYIHRAMWQYLKMGGVAQKEGCDLVFVPGGSFATRYRPVVTMNRNLLPFQWNQIKKYGLSLTSLRLLLLRWLQSRSLKKANGCIYLTRHAKEQVTDITGAVTGDSVIIPHGISNRFFMEPRVPRMLEDCTEDDPFKIVYVSIINVYKHQKEVIDAVSMLRSKGLLVQLDLVGPAYKSELIKVKRIMEKVDPNMEYIRYLGPIPHEDIQKIYRKSDLAVFASDCETFGQILTEYMAAGLPIVCSNKSAMPEILCDAGIYFDPENPREMFDQMYNLIVSPEMREQMAWAAYKKARDYSWDRCAYDTFSFLASVANRYRSRLANPRRLSR